MVISAKIFDSATSCFIGMDDNTIIVGAEYGVSYSSCKRNCGTFDACCSYHSGGNHGLKRVSLIIFSVAAGWADRK